MSNTDLTPFDPVTRKKVDIKEKNKALVLFQRSGDRDSLFMAPRIFINDLRAGIADPKRIFLLVVHGAHRATGSYAYVEVVTFLNIRSQHGRDNITDMLRLGQHYDEKKHRGQIPMEAGNAAHILEGKGEYVFRHGQYLCWWFNGFTP